MSDYVSAGDLVATLEDLDNMKLDFRVPEKFNDHLELGQPVRFELSEPALDLIGTIVASTRAAIPTPV